MTVTGLGSASTWGALAQSVGTSKPGQPAKPAYGLAFRFVVKLDDLTDLGGWQSCSGLKVEYKSEPMRSGGAYAGNTWVPSELVWSKIVLKRAVNAVDTKKVQEYLEKFGRGWINGKPAEPQGGVITLYDGNGKPVMWWELKMLRPAAWSGPDLDAGSGKVAIETLELVHEGFKVFTGGSSTAPPRPSEDPDVSDAPPALVLQSAVNPNEKVEFPYPPLNITASKTLENGGTLGASQRAQQTVGNSTATVADDAKDGGAGSGGQVSINLGIEPNILQWSLSTLRLEGSGIFEQVKLMERWTTKTPAKDPKAAPTQEPLVWTWGTQFTNIPVYLKKMDAKFTRFDSQGVPIRAEITLSFNSRVAWMAAKPSANKGERKGPTIGASRTGARNPTSGGIPGRAAHVVLESENLAALSLATYDDPKRWRAIAEANRIDDPLRVRPGTTLYLPSHLEVET